MAFGIYRIHGVDINRDYMNPIIFQAAKLAIGKTLDISDSFWKEMSNFVSKPRPGTFKIFETETRDLQKLCGPSNLKTPLSEAETKYF